VLLARFAPAGLSNPAVHPLDRQIQREQDKVIFGVEKCGENGYV
jgi:hypothetical protein